MVTIGRGIVKGSNIELEKPVSLPEGTEVVLQIVPVDANTSKEKVRIEDFLQQPWFGIWKDRDDMQDSVKWVEEERRNWNGRLWNGD